MMREKVVLMITSCHASHPPLVKAIGAVVSAVENTQIC